MFRRRSRHIFQQCQSPICWAALLLCLLPQALRAQETREQQIAQEQAEKVQRLQVEGPTRGEQVVIQLMKSPLLAGTGGVFPWFGSVYEGTSLGFGGGYLRRMARRSELTAIAGVSLNGSTLVRADYIAPRLLHNTIEPFASARWTRVKDVSFFGLGNDSRQADRSGYDFNPSLFRTGVAFRPAESLGFSASFERLGFQTHVDATARATTAFVLPSDNQTLYFNGFQFGAALDTRTSRGYSTRGTLLRATTARYYETKELLFDFQQSEFEVVQLVPLLREQFVLAFHALATFTTPEDGNTAPLALLPYLGSGTTIRGFETRRFVDRDRLLFTGEYRWRPSRYVDMALFIDAGQVATTREQLSADRFRTSWGIGARFHGPAFSALRIELARSAEGSRLIFATGGPF